MIEALDHVAVRVADVAVAARAYEALLGHPPLWRETIGGGRLARFQLANMAIELRSTPGPEGLFGLAFAAVDLDETHRVLARRGAPTQVEDDAAVVDCAATCGVRIALVPRDPASSPTPTAIAGAGSVVGLDHLVIHTPNPDRAVALYGARLGLDFRLDRANPQWGSRLMFFRCGGCVVEIGADLAAPLAGGPDRLSGLAFRVEDPDAARARMAASDFDVSEVRSGRKPGTRVFTVRSGFVGAPALIIGGGGGES